ncbi:MAG: DUF2249 domain-containing protein [Flavobacteriales bacterium]|nr:DUF2249 domain-containing protein [Flavobacteriales bacterium]MEB2341749.1 DUF2249 domain-containing protein [Flavobacteriia bacterium]
MLKIDANTKISHLLRENPDALEAIVGLSPKFTKLRNPLLRKLMASRTTIGMASKIGGCKPEDFFAKLRPLGFEVNTEEEEVAEEALEAAPMPAFMKQLKPTDVVDLDVRPILNAGQDPFNLILKQVGGLAPGQALKIINDFDPIPLVQLLEKRGFETYGEVLDGGIFHTYFFKGDEVRMGSAKAERRSADWEEKLKHYEGRMKEIDVRALEMPLPMMTILEELDQLPAGHALYVNHKRIPMFLLPELEDRKFDYRSWEIEEGNVKMLIFSKA